MNLDKELRVEGANSQTVKR